MFISQKTHYALRAMFELTASYGSGPRKIGDIAKAQQIPLRFLEVIMGELRQAGFVDSKRGARGGYVLAREPSEVTVGEMLRFLEGPLGPVNCADSASTAACGFDGDCAYKTVWQRVHEAVRDVVDSVTLADLLEQQRQRSEKYVPNYAI